MWIIAILIGMGIGLCVKNLDAVRGLLRFVRIKKYRDGTYSICKGWFLEEYWYSGPCEPQGDWWRSQKNKYKTLEEALKVYNQFGSCCIKESEYKEK